MLSIIIPFYNSAKFLPQLEQSLLSQTVPDSEVIIVDDNSDSAQLAALKVVAQTHNWRVIELAENAGPGNARNLGIAHARGSHICFLDADDTLSPQALAQLSQVIHTHPDIDVIAFDMAYQKDGAETIYEMIPGAASALPSTGGMVDAKYALCHIRSGTAGKCYRRALILENTVQFGHLKRHEDTAFTKSALSVAEKIYYLPIPLYHYIYNETSLTNEACCASFTSSFAALELVKRVAPKEKALEVQYVYLIEVIVSCMQKVSLLKISRAEFIQLCERFATEEPNWFQNPYLPNSSKPHRVYAYLAHKRCYTLVKLVNLAENIARKLLRKA